MPFSGPTWIAQFPGSQSLDDLAEPFQSNAKAFINALRTAGADVIISATLRPPQRAYLMHFCCQIAKNEVDPATVPPFAGVDIQWQHTDESGNIDLAATKAAAAQMVAGYDIAFPPVLVSRHTQGLAVDMTISWNGALTIQDATGNAITIATEPRSGANSDLQEVGKTYGVIKLATDPPHWSSDGH
jgi:hypothetical protein